MSAPTSSDADSIRITVFGQTDVGRKRRDNQDSYLVADLSTDDSGDSFLLNAELAHTPEASGFNLGPRGAVLMVADGMGGAAAGSIASKLAVSRIYRQVVAHWGADDDGSARRFAACLQRAVEEANTEIHDLAGRNSDYQGMGTTTTLVGILGACIYLANVGDSRAYLVRGGRITQLTRDQSMVQELVTAGVLTEEEAERSSYGNVILQAVGASPEVQVDLTFQEIRRGDLLILCSDGLSRTVRNEQIMQVIAQSSCLPELCGALVEQANQAGGPDNITVIAARVDGGGLRSAADGEVVGHRVFAAAET